MSYKTSLPGTNSCAMVKITEIAFSLILIVNVAHMCVILHTVLLLYDLLIKYLINEKV